MKSVVNLRCDIDLDTGPFIYLDNVLHFLFIFIPELSRKRKTFLSLKEIFLLVRQIHTLQISPFTLYLYLKPLYSILGGSTTLDDPLTKNPSLVDFLLKPLYK